MLVVVRLAAFAVAAALWMSSTASAHVSVANNPVVADANAVVTLSVGHGCEGADTIQIEATLPEAVTTVRGMPSFMGNPELKTNDAGVIRSLVWRKTDFRPADDFYYQLSFRIRVPNTPFTVLYFPVKQTCKKADGSELVVDWAAVPKPGEEMSGEEGPPPAAELVIMPARKAGWNKYTVAKAVTDLSIFDDAQIVWAGNAAYSSNKATADLIASEDGVEKLTEIKANTEIWVKY